MLILAVLLALPTLLGLAFFAVPRAHRRDGAYTLLGASIFGYPAVLAIIVAVNMGWISP
ncbi:MAG: hypothetical protein ABIS07_07780 [Dokdonella sp.]